MPPITLKGKRLADYQNAVRSAASESAEAAEQVRSGDTIIVRPSRIEELRMAAANLLEAADLLETAEDDEQVEVK